MNRNFFDFNESEMQVNVGVFLPGNCGVNQAAMFMGDTDPQEAPGLHFFVPDADAPLLRERFASRSTGRSEADRLIKKWIDSGRFVPIQLGKDGVQSAGGRRRKLHGAGGDPNFGKELVLQSLPQIGEAMENMDLIFNWGAGGGGIGTAALELIAMEAKQRAIDALSILITPFGNEGSKLVIANDLRVKLREITPLMVIRNESLPMERRNVLPSEAFAYINHRCRPIFQALRELTQVVGTSNNVDFEDLIRAMKLGKDLYVGVDSSSAERATAKAEAKNIVHELMNDIFQQKMGKAKALLFCFEGPWTVSLMDEVIGGVQQFSDFPSSGLVKRQTNERSETMQVSVICFGEHGEKDPASTVDNRLEAVVSSPVPKSDAQATLTHTRAKKTEEMVKERWKSPSNTYQFRVGGSSQTLRIPIRLYHAWRAAQDQDRQPELQDLAEDISFYHPQRLRPDVPKYAVKAS